MFNPWSQPPPQTHTHHGHHTQPQHHSQPGAHHTQPPTVTTATAPVPGTVPGTLSMPSAPGTRLDLDTSPNASSPSSSPYGMSAQMRSWLPSMITPAPRHTNGHGHGHGHNGHNQGHHASLPTISSGLRMQHPGPGNGAAVGMGVGSGTNGHMSSQAQVQAQAQAHAQAQAQRQQQQQGRVPMVLQAQAQARAAQPVESTGGIVQPVVGMESESERSDTPGGTPGGRDIGGADAIGEPEFGAENGPGKVDRDGDIDIEAIGENGNGTGNGNRDMPLPSDINLSARKHGKRLTTKEEVSLFEICNRHAAEFGRRSNLCKWWMTVTMEFTRGQKHPYSWHSVRRKVEIVTKQRMKFLEEQRDKGASEADDLSNPRWRAVVDAWIPTWQRWEEAEAQRIEKRDSKRPRKRKWSVNTPTSTPSTIAPGCTASTGASEWDISASAPSTGPDWRAASSTESSPMVNHRVPSPTPLSSTPVRLPPGFDTLFSQSSQKPLPSSTTSTPYNSNITRPHLQANHLNNPSTPATNQTQTPVTAPPQSATPTPDNPVMAAVLETLGKLNKHLETNSNPNSTSNSNPAASILPALNLTATNAITGSGTPSNSEPPSAQPLPATQDSALDGGGLSDDFNLSALSTNVTATALSRLKQDLKNEMMSELRAEWDKERAVLDEKLDSVQRTQEMILEMLRQEPSS